MLSFTGQMKIVGVVVESRVSYGYSLQLLYPSAKVLGNGLCTVPLDRRTGAVEHLDDGFLDTVQSGEAHPVETVDQSDLFGMGDLERFGSQIVPLVDPYGGGFETQRCATVEYGDETLDLQRDQIAEDAEIPEVAVLVGYDEIQSYHPVQTPFHIHAPDVLER